MKMARSMHTKAQCPIARPENNATTRIVTTTDDQRVNDDNDYDEATTIDDGEEEGGRRVNGEQKEDSSSIEDEEVENDTSVDDNGPTMQLVDVLNSDSAAAGFEQPSPQLVTGIQVQRPPLDIGTFVRLNTVIIGLDPDYLLGIPAGRERQVYGQIISIKSRKYKVRWLTGNYQPEPELDYSVARLFSLLRTEISEEHGLIG